MIRKASATKQISTIIFDLSEVFIAGLIGVEEHLTDRLQMPPVEVLAAFRCELLDELCCGVISEDAYLSHLLERHGWAITEGELKALIRQNFHRKVPGMDAVLSVLLGHYQLFLPVRKRIGVGFYYREVHPFLTVFDARFFSYQIGQIKRDSS